jgi:TolA-binding protein
MTESKGKNFVERLADVGEEAIQRIGSAPGADRIMGPLNSVRERVDELQRRVRGLEDMEKRLTSVERRLDELDGGDKSAEHGASATAPSSTTERSTSTESGSDLGNSNP